jgi:hypothetical protein
MTFVGNNGASLTVSRTAKLRKQAELCRRVASVPTKGGHHEDRVLLAVAAELERKAEALDGGRTAGHPLSGR